MSTTTKYELLEAMRSRYKAASKSLKKQILNEFCSLAGYHRKYAIRLFNSSITVKSIENLSRRGRKKIYDRPILIEIIRDIWVTTNLPCSKRLKAIIHIWLPFYKKREVTDDIRNQLLSISPATIDRLMAPARAKFNKMGLATTKPGSILKKHIPVKTNQWDETKPGFLEADSVAHCGNSVAGMFVYTINCVDIASEWTEQRAVWGKGERNVCLAIQNIENNLPFPILGFDCDNGSEFLNWHLIRYLTNHRKKPIHFTRSRAYQKNDNAHIENKNWTHVRQYLGFQRFDKPELVHLLNDLYTSEWNLYFNYFVPSVKLIRKQRIGSKIIKKYDKPKTPFERIVESDYIDQIIKSNLIKQFESLNPFRLQKNMKKKIDRILNIVNQS
jgi:hypothetical protein